MDRRSFINQTALVTGGLALAPNIVWSKSNNDIFKRPTLPYNFQDYEPHIDQQTMQIHYEKHFKSYTDNLNKAVKEDGLKNKSIEEIIVNLDVKNSFLRNNAGGYHNHKLFFESLSPNPKERPNKLLSDAIDTEFGSFDKFKELFSAKAATVFGSGWAWLILKENGRLAISATHNQDSPLMTLVEEPGTPLMGIDVWEHAYYLKYQNRRKEYISSFFHLLDWEIIDERYKNGQG